MGRSSIETMKQENAVLAALSSSRLSLFKQNKRNINIEFPFCDVNDMLLFRNKYALVRLKVNRFNKQL